MLLSALGIQTFATMYCFVTSGETACGLGAASSICPDRPLRFSPEFVMRPLPRGTDLSVNFVAYVPAGGLRRAA